ncbi:hypothetical protein B7494_g5916 [Chlorociboria aeruginascens]|nr:hypothetical protein B7494_g5916 [Chlorociboria aeruginascens]
MADIESILHDTAKLNEPDSQREPSEFWIAVLPHHKDPLTCTGSDFLWFKCKGKHTVAKVISAYVAKTSTNVYFQYRNNATPQHTPVRDLNFFGDNIIVFWARTGKPNTLQVEALRPDQSTQSPRVPLHNLMNQMRSPVSAKKAYSSPYNNDSPSGSRNLTDSLPQGSATLRSSIHNVANSLSDSALRSLKKESSDQSINPEIKGVANESSGISDAPASDTKSEADEAPITSSSGSSSSAQAKQSGRLQKVITEGSPEVLEAEVKRSVRFLNELKPLFEGSAAENEHTQHWLTQIGTMADQTVESPTIIGVVGNTGAGKSSIINAILDEERLVPTNCMRACTAVVTELSWNSNNDPDSKYRADIEFIHASDWEKELRVLFSELLDASGNIRHDASSIESDAGVAYAKIRAVYPKIDLAHSTVEKLLEEPCVRDILGTTKKINRAAPEPFYLALQSYVDSKEKSTEKKKKGERKEMKQMEFWPLIKVVRIFTKSEALSTGAVVVDLPGVHDSNAARAAVAERYMKQCTGLWIVAPINRAVDDKAAKNLMGESFKRQLKYDGTYSRVTFICSKTDDISITEASDSLGLAEEMVENWKKVDNFEKEISLQNKSVEELKESKAIYDEVMNEIDDQVEIWEKLKDEIDDGKTVYAPTEGSKKRKRSAEPKKSKKHARSRTSLSEAEDELDDFIDDDEAEQSQKDASCESEDEPNHVEPLTAEAVDENIAELKTNKKIARRERTQIDIKVKDLNELIKGLERKKDGIEAQMSAICIAGRNDYSKSAIQQDFAAGIKELDQENALEEDEENFDPDEDVRDYDEVARSLPVFCVSSRAYQKLSGRLQRDNDVPGFQSLRETEIPQLQAHCKTLTEAGRASNCRQFLNNFCQLINSLNLWSSNDGTGVSLSDSQKATEAKFLNKSLENLEKNLDKSVESCLQELKQILSENIFEKYDSIVQAAANEAVPTATKWGAPVNQENRAAGGYHWSTYKAICRRDGVYTNARGPHDFNQELTEPMMKLLASHWEKAFARRLPQVLEGFARSSNELLKSFHQQIESRAVQHGGIAGVAMLHQQLQNYKAILKDSIKQMNEVVNALQREANREFTPVIAGYLASAYAWCAAETGAGQYGRMRQHMLAHIDNNRSVMFAEACQRVKDRLSIMCRAVEEIMSNKTDEVFMLMRRDYLTVINGALVPQGELMPKWERQLRAAVSKAIEDRQDAPGEPESHIPGKTIPEAATQVGTESAVVGEAANTKAEHVEMADAPYEGNNIKGG